MEFKKKELDNGLVIIGELNGSAKSAAVGFFVKTGARDESEDINGVSHFLEHMMFKGTEWLSALEVNETFDRTGAQYNAFTSEENTVYYAAVLPEFAEEVTHLWIELMRPALRNEDFNIEKNVIKEEIAMYKDQPSYDVVERCRKLYFDRHPCGNSVLGSEESIDRMTAEQMRGYFGRRYAPNNMMAAIAGNFDWENISGLIEKVCGKWQRMETGRKLERWPGNVKNGSAEKANLTCAHIGLMSEAVSAQDKDRYAATMLATIIGDDSGSRFFWEIVDKAMAETATMQYEGMDGTGAFYSYIRCGSENKGSVMDKVREILAQARKEGVTQDELTMAKNKILSSLVIKNELPMGRLVDLGFNWIYNKEYRSVADDINAIKTVTKDQVDRLLQELRVGEFTQFSIGPEKS